MTTSRFFDYPDQQQTAEAPGFLASMPEDEVKVLLTYAQNMRFRAGDMALRFGERDRTLYIVLNGQFEVLIPTPQGQVRVSQMDVGDIFGELAFFDGQPRSANIRAVRNSEVVTLTSASFDRLRVARPQLALAVTMDLGRVLSLRFREINSRLVALQKV